MILPSSEDEILTRQEPTNLGADPSVTIDSLVFDEHERGPQDDLALAFEATRHLTPEEQATVRELIEAMLLKHEARRWAS